MSFLSKQFGGIFSYFSNRKDDDDKTKQTPGGIQGKNFLSQPSDLRNTQMSQSINTRFSRGQKKDHDDLEKITQLLQKVSLYRKEPDQYDLLGHLPAVSPISVLNRSSISSNFSAQKKENYINALSILKTEKITYGLLRSIVKFFKDESNQILIFLSKTHRIAEVKRNINKTDMLDKSPELTEQGEARKKQIEKENQEKIENARRIEYLNSRRQNIPQQIPNMQPIIEEESQTVSLRPQIPPIQIAEERFHYGESMEIEDPSVVNAQEQDLDDINASDNDDPEESSKVFKKNADAANDNELDCNESQRVQKYNAIIKGGYFLPKLSSSAVTKESLDLFNNQNFCHVSVGEIAHLTNLKRKLRFSAQVTWEAFQRKLLKLTGNLFPYRTAPNTKFIKIVIELKFPGNGLKFFLSEEEEKKKVALFESKIIHFAQKIALEKEKLEIKKEKLEQERVRLVKRGKEICESHITNHARYDASHTKRILKMIREKGDIYDLYLEELGMDKPKFDLFLKELDGMYLIEDLDGPKTRFKFLEKASKKSDMNLFNLFQETSEVGFLKFMEINTNMKLTSDQQDQLERVENEIAEKLYKKKDELYISIESKNFESKEYIRKCITDSESFDDLAEIESILKKIDKRMSKVFYTDGFRDARESLKKMFKKTNMDLSDIKELALEEGSNLSRTLRGE